MYGDKEIKTGKRIVISARATRIVGLTGSTVRET